MRNLLICAQNFPPLGGGGVIRMVKFAKYLPEFGWNPIVLTVAEDQHVGNPIDPSLAAQLDPGLTIIRARTIGVRGQPQTGAGVNTNSSGEPPVSNEAALQAHSSTIRRTLKSLTRRYRVWEDHGYLWLPNATRAAFKAADRYKLDAVLTTSPPHATQWIGYWLRRFRHIPWVVDFRDGWTDDPLFQSESELRNRIERMQERMIVSSANYVVCAAETIRNDLLGKYSHIAPEKVEVLLNGFDPADFAPSSTDNTSRVAQDGDNAPKRPLRISYLGSVGGAGRPIAPLLQALRNLTAADMGADSIEVTFAGTMPDDDRAAATVLPNVQVLGYLPHDEAVRHMQEADVLLGIMGPDMGKAVAGKLYEYAAAGKPILLLSGPGPSPDLVLKNRWGWVCDTFDSEGIASALRECVRLYWEGNLQAYAPSPNSLEQYDRRKVTERLAGILDTIGSGRTG